MSILDRLVRLHGTVFGAIERSVDAWLPGLAARFVFAAVLFLYFWNSAMTKIGDGALGIFTITDGAYFQILPAVVERFGYDASAVPFLPHGLIVMLGTYGEILLPILVVVGLFTRIAALGMIVFVIVQSYVDIAFHGLEPEAVGALFDRFQDSVVSDQRLLWVFPLLYLVLRGPGLISLDAVLGRKLRDPVDATVSAPAP